MNHRRIALRPWIRPGLLAVGIVLVLVTPPRSRYVPLAETAPQADTLVTAEVKALQKKIRQVLPERQYIVVDSRNNVVQLRTRDDVLLEAPCSTGSGKSLKDPNADRTWTFNTPLGVHRVISKSMNPVWRKPDWHYVEENEPLPSDDGERFEHGVLGKYALYFGDGYLIHGTLYERLLGRSVSHGCVRVGAEPLAALYRSADVGTPIFIH